MYIRVLIPFCAAFAAAAEEFPAEAFLPPVGSSTVGDTNSYALEANAAIEAVQDSSYGLNNSLRKRMWSNHAAALAAVVIGVATLFLVVQCYRFLKDKNVSNGAQQRRLAGARKPFDGCNPQDFPGAPEGGDSPSTTPDLITMYTSQIHKSAAGIQNLKEKIDDIRREKEQRRQRIRTLQEELRKLELEEEEVQAEVDLVIKRLDSYATSKQELEKQIEVAARPQPQQRYAEDDYEEEAEALAVPPRAPAEPPTPEPAHQPAAPVPLPRKIAPKDARAPPHTHPVPVEDVPGKEEADADVLPVTHGPFRRAMSKSHAESVTGVSVQKRAEQYERRSRSKEETLPLERRPRSRSPSVESVAHRFEERRGPAPRTSESPTTKVQPSYSGLTKKQIKIVQQKEEAAKALEAEVRQQRASMQFVEDKPKVVQKTQATGEVSKGITKARAHLFEHISSEPPSAEKTRMQEVKFQNLVKEIQAQRAYIEEDSTTDEE